MELGGTGVWSGQLRYGDPGEKTAAAAELEALGYTAIWLPGGAGGAVFDDCRALLDATERIPVATGILNLWMHTPQETAEGHAALHERRSRAGSSSASASATGRSSR